jgi:hypothetical protein
MSAVGEEIMGSRGGSDKNLERHYTVRVTGSSTPEEEVLDWVYSNAPGSLAGLVLSSISLEESEEVQDLYEAPAQYSELEKKDPPATDSMEYKFSFQAQGVQVYQSLMTLASYAAPSLSEGAPNFNGAINVVNDGGKQRVEGFNIQPPPETFTLSYYPVNATVSGSYQLLVESLCGTVNNTSFRGRPAGSTMLTRVSGGVRTNESWSIEFGFGYVANQTGIPVGDEITVSSKDGLDLLWPWYGTIKDDDAKALVANPRAAYVERVWYRANLNSLSLPS